MNEQFFAPYKLGVDLGGPVIVSPQEKTPQGYRHTQQTPDAFISLLMLTLFSRVNPTVLSGIHLISQCTPEIEAVKRELLPELGFYAETMIDPGQLYFCREPQDKATYCELMGINYLIEDRPRIMSYALPYLRRGFLFRPDPQELEQFPDVARRVTIVQSWSELTPLLFKSFYS